MQNSVHTNAEVNTRNNYEIMKPIMDIFCETTDCASATLHTHPDMYDIFLFPILKIQRNG